MPEANKMANFMHDGSISYAIFCQIYALAKAVTHSTNIWTTAAWKIRGNKQTIETNLESKGKDSIGENK